MYPYYAGFVPNFALAPDDEMGIQELYGKKTIIQTTISPTTRALLTGKVTTTKYYVTSTTTKKITSTTSTKTTTVTTNSNLVKACTKTLEAIFLGPKNNIFVLIDHSDLFEYDATRNIWISRKLVDLYPR